MYLVILLFLMRNLCLEGAFWIILRRVSSKKHTFLPKCRKGKGRYIYGIDYRVVNKADYN